MLRETPIPSRESAGPESERALSAPFWLSVAEWLVLAILVAQFCVRTLPAAWRTLNTDFPNYYVTASLVREHFDTSRVYEWIWFARQKDYRAIDQRIAGMVPLTVFS